MNNQLKMFEIHDEYNRLIKETAFDKRLEKTFFNITNEVWVKKDALKSSLDIIKASINEIKNHLKRKDKMQYDWEFDINQSLDVINTEVESWQKN